jgi:copper chaperone NosL
MKLAVPAIVGVALLACSSLQPLPIRSGETCYGCRQSIGEPRIATEMIDANGHAFKFDSVECLGRYINEHPDEKVAGVFVTDFKTGRLIGATHATFAKGNADPRTMMKVYAAFASSDDAQAFAKEQNSTPGDWKTVLQSLKTN